MPIEDHLKLHFLPCLEKFIRKDELSPGDVRFDEIRKILVVRSHDQLGDFLLATPVLRALREHFPHVQIGVLVRDYFAEVARCVPYCDIVLSFSGAIGRWRWEDFTTFRRQLRSGWDLAIVLNTVSHSLTSDLLAHFSGARYILGPCDDPFPRCTRNFFYNLLALRREMNRHQTDLNLDIVRFLGIDTHNFGEEIVVPVSERDAAREHLSNLRIPFDSALVGIHLGAGKAANRWPVENFAAFASRLHAEHNIQIALFWGPSEANLALQFLSKIDFQPVSIEPTTLVRLAAFFTQCSAIICNDTGVMHLAAATGVPVLALFGPTDPKQWMPKGVNHRYLRGSDMRVESIAVPEVTEVILSMLGAQSIQH